MRLDRDIDLDSEAYRQRRREAIDNFERGGVEVAPAHYRRRDVDASTISESYYYGSRNSMELQGYISSSQVPDYESSDCRVHMCTVCLLFVVLICLFTCLLLLFVCCIQDEDGESVYSQARYQLPVPSFMGEVTVVRA